MRVMETKVYTFDELSDEAKEKAIDRWRESDNYPWHEDNSAALEEFEKIFPIKSTSWEYGYHNFINSKITCDDELSEIKGVRLYKHLMFNYYETLFPKKYIGHKLRKYHLWKREEAMLTGYCIGRDILEPIYKFLKKPDNTSFGELLRDCLEEWIIACNKDYEYSNSDECIIENIKANEYEFTAGGRMI